MKHVKIPANVAKALKLKVKAEEDKSPFITDYGRELKVDDATGEVGTRFIPRYSVWAWHRSKGKHQIVDSDNNLNKLLKKYKLTKKDVHKLGK